MSTPQALWSTRALVLAQPLEIRPSRPDDTAAMAALYAACWREGLTTFEDRAPSEAELAERREVAVGAGLPHLVAVTGSGTVVGYCWATPFRRLAAYRLAVEDSIYVHPEARGLRVGRRLLARLIEDCGAQGLCPMIAVIGDRLNTASLALHYSLGFAAVGVLPGVAFRPGAWVDTMILQKQLRRDPPPAGRLH